MNTKNLSVILCSALLTACSGNKDAHDASGIFETTETIVSARTSGLLTAFDVEEGKDLQSGAKVGCVDTALLSLRRSELKASAGSAAGSVLDISRQSADLRRQIENARQELTRAQQLVAAKAGTQQQTDHWQNQLNVLTSQLAATEEKIAASNKSATERERSILAQLAQVEEQIAQSHIIVPTGGTVLEKYAEQGEYVTPGRPLFKIADLQQMKLRAYVTAEQFAKLKIGQKVRVVSDCGGDTERSYEGRVEWISDKAEFTPKTIQTKDERANLVYAVKIAVTNDGFIKRGMYGDVDF